MTEQVTEQYKRRMDNYVNSTLFMVYGLIHGIGGFVYGANGWNIPPEQPFEAMNPDMVQILSGVCVSMLGFAVFVIGLGLWVDTRSEKL